MLTKLKPAAISSAYSKALKDGRRDGTGGLSPRTVTHMHRVLKQALGQAVKWDLLARNPADAVDPPKVERVAMAAFDMAQTAELLEFMRGTRMFMPTVLAVLRPAAPVNRMVAGSNPARGANQINHLSKIP